MSDQSPDPLTAQQAARVTQAFRLLQRGEGGAALSIARRVVSEKPRSPDAHHLVALCYKASNDYDESEMAFQKALQLAPDNPEILGNYANLLKRRGRLDDALHHCRRAVKAAPALAKAWLNLGLAALSADRAAEAREGLERAVRLDPKSSSAWQALGSAHRAVGDLEGAEKAFRKSVGLRPENGAAWVNLSVVVRLLGRPAEALPFLDEARKAGFIAPELADAESGALVDLGEIEPALDVVRHLTQSAPHYTVGHVTLARLLWEYGNLLSPGEDPFAAFRKAADDQPGNGALQLEFIRFLMEADRAEEAVDRVHALRTKNSTPALTIVEANALDALGHTEDSARLYEHAYGILGVRSAAFLNSYTRHLLRIGEWGKAAARAEEAVQDDADNQEAWGYLGTAWRLLDDPREHWLCDYERLIALVEVIPPDTFANQTEFVSSLAATLDPLHKASREPVNQSLRGGSQTPGRLFGRPVPLIDDARIAIADAVKRHIASLPDDPKHPFLRRKKPSVSFAGSWSVKLWSSGRHINHFHPQGWMSSAYYVSLPPSVDLPEERARRSGWIQFGQPPEDLGLELAPRRFIQPKVGHVALFPSYMWHGTVPFEDSEPRVTMAFDMTPAE
jgi:Tfp pilus assembly protein PilF